MRTLYTNNGLSITDYGDGDIRVYGSNSKNLSKFAELVRLFGIILPKYNHTTNPFNGRIHIFQLEDVLWFECTREDIEQLIITYNDIIKDDTTTRKTTKIRTKSN